VNRWTLFYTCVNRRGEPIGRYRLLFTLVLLLLTACQGTETAELPPLVVTEVVVLEGEEIVVTRLVRQTIEVTATPQPVTAVVRPVELDIGFVGSFPNVDPQQTEDDNGLHLVENLFVGLTNYNHETNLVEPELAMEWTVSDDGRVWTFILRQDIFWVRPTPPPATGTDRAWLARPQRPVVAADVVAAVQRACTRRTNTADAYILFLIQGCERVYQTAEPSAVDLAAIGITAVNNYTLQVTLNRPGSHFLTITTMPFFHPIMPELLEEVEERWQMADNVVTSGPFMPVLTSWGGRRVTLQRNPLWPITRPGGNVDIINVNFLEDEENAFRLWQAKRLDVIPLPAAERANMLSSAPQKVRLIAEQTLFYLGYNFSSPVFREPTVRRAFASAIDREQLIDELYNGRALLMRHLTPPGVVGAPPIHEVGRGYSTDYALQQLDASGFGSCRLMPPITFMVSSSDLSLRQAELLRDMWIDVLGCEKEQITIEQVPFGTLLANTRQDAGAARPDIWELGWASYYPDAHNWLSDLLHCADSDNRQNRPCSEVDDLIRQADTVTDPEQRQALYRQIENLFFGGDGIEPVTPLYTRGNYILVQSWLTFTPALFGGEQYDTYRVDGETKRLEQSRGQ
jgi:oligopeptide transport system substrate-binding protein